MHMKRLLAYGLPAMAYLVFFFWYTSFGGPLTEAEINRYVGLMRANAASEARIGQVTRFMREDTGNDFVMLNTLDMADHPPDLPATGHNANPDALMDYYMEFMYPELFARACHPIFFGDVVFGPLDAVAVVQPPAWDRAALMRYRSRRDMMEIATNPAFMERHDYKTGALDRTLAYPVEASINLADPRFLLAMILLLIALVTDIMFGTRARAS
jgi:hypothetical protein